MEVARSRSLVLSDYMTHSTSTVLSASVFSLAALVLFGFSVLALQLWFFRLQRHTQGARFLRESGSLCHNGSFWQHNTLRKVRFFHASRLAQGCRFFHVQSARSITMVLSWLASSLGSYGSFAQDGSFQDYGSFTRDDTCSWTPVLSLSMAHSIDTVLSCMSACSFGTVLSPKTARSYLWFFPSKSAHSSGPVLSEVQVRSSCSVLSQSTARSRYMVLSD